MQRGLSPSTEEGAAELRASVLTETNRLQWDRVCELVEEYRQQQQQQQQQAVPDGAATLGDSARAAEFDAPSSARRAPAMGPVVSSTKRDGAPPPSGATDLKGTVVTLLGSPEGATLRRMLRDVDSTDLILTLSTSARARPIRRVGVEALSAALTDAVTASSACVAAAARGSSGSAKAAPTPPLPTSTKSEASRRRRQVRSGTVTRLLLATHARRALANKWRSAAAIGGLVWLFARVGVAAVLKSALRALRPGGRSLLAPVALAGAVVAVFEKVIGDRSMIWRSSVADDAAAALQVSRAEAAGLPVRVAGW